MPKKGLSGEQNWHWEKADPQCELNTLEYPAGATPLHQVFEKFECWNQIKKKHCIFISHVHIIVSYF